MTSVSSGWMWIAASLRVNSAPLEPSRPRFVWALLYGKLLKRTCSQLLKYGRLSMAL